MRDDQMKDLFMRFLEDDCSPEEIRQLLAYLENAADASALPSVEEFEHAFPALPSLDAETSGKVYDKLALLIDARRRAVSLRPWLKIAASVTILLSLSLTILWLSGRFSVENHRTGYAEIRTVELEDGSLISMNANSTMKTSFSGNIREVWLEGEAFFRVRHDASRKFVVHTSDGLAVEVLGTEFNVKGRPEGTSVVLNKGSVKVKLEGSEGTREMLMVPGEMVEYRVLGENLRKSQADTASLSAWKQNLLVFEEATLASVARTMEHQFGYTVHLASDSLAALQFTGSNPADDPETLLKTLEKSFGLSVRLSGKEVWIGDGEN